jgi:hypothetical protein
VAARRRAVLVQMFVQQRGQLQRARHRANLFDAAVLSWRVSPRLPDLLQDRPVEGEELLR